MRIIFWGTTEFGFKCLKKLLEMKENVVAIFTTPSVLRVSWSEKPVKLVTHKNFKKIALKNNIPVIEIVGRMKNYTDLIKSFKPDLILVIGWYYIIPKIILDILPLGCVGIHASLLPKYRGGAPLTWAIINGETETGVSLFCLTEGIDSGDIIAQKKIPISKNDNIKTVYQKTTKAALKILEKYIPLIKSKRVPKIKQDERQATYFPLRKPEDGLINWNKTSLEIHNWIRAQTKPYSGAFFFDEAGRKIKVWNSKLPSKIKKSSEKPGTILEQSKRKIKIATGNGYIVINDYEMEK